MLRFAEDLGHSEDMGNSEDIGCSDHMGPGKAEDKAYRIEPVLTEEKGSLMAFGLLRTDRHQYYTPLSNPYCFMVIGESSTNGICDKSIAGFRPFRSLTTLLGLTELWKSQLVVSKRWIERTTETAVPPRRYIAQRSAVKYELVLF
ncbi:unnamed protein product [Toxocara canis]|uniref:Uncharacterized protein n=1 Tax=Toxocara canis TaxID=6265 RepID=A0A183U3I3_TOXCA|nr:unnamed protein product [Toxocara canis]